MLEPGLHSFRLATRLQVYPDFCFLEMVFLITAIKKRVKFWLYLTQDGGPTSYITVKKTKDLCEMGPFKLVSRFYICRFDILPYCHR